MIETEQQRTEQILIVDDEPINLRLLRAHLVKQGFEVLEAANGDEALEQAAAQPDLILLDIMMPGMDGFETCSKLKENDDLKHIPVIFLSALTDTDIKTKGLEAGGVDYVSKPFDSRELLARVRTHLTLKRQERQIRLYADKLEDMVQERTQKLQEAEHELQRDYDIQTVVNALLRSTIDNIPLEEMLQNSLQQMLGVDWQSFLPRGSIMLANEETGALKLVAAHNFVSGEASPCDDVTFGHCACGVTAERKQSMIIHSDDPLHVNEGIGAAPHTHYCTPIMHGDKVLGVVNVHLKDNAKPDSKEQEFLGAVSNTLARLILYKQTEAQLLFHAYHDALTKLPNRTYITDLLAEHVQKRAQSEDPASNEFGLLLVDLDRFNMINESLGHDVGDQLLQELAERLTGLLGEGDVIARLGGDEFAILTPTGDDISQVTELAKRILNVIRQPFTLAGQELFTTLSIGIALSSIGYERPEDVIRDADTALHRAKLSGKARYVVFDQEMHQKALKLMQLVTNLRLAIAREEFILHYQPIIDVKAGSTMGFEALVRWIHPVEGMISPGEFIPVAEETSLIIPIGQWVLREACKDMKALYAENGQDNCGMISVNISGKQFSHEDLFNDVSNTLEVVGLEPHCLKLEITETVVMENAKSAVEMLEKLKSLNVQLSIDDFGTGYSSLSYLHRFPVDMLKVDRSFVSSMNDSAENLEIVRTIISLAHDMGLKVIAEGVETAEQLRIIIEMGCEYVQGFYFSKPLPLEEVKKQNLLHADWK